MAWLSFGVINLGSVANCQMGNGRWSTVDGYDLTLTIRPPLYVMHGSQPLSELAVGKNHHSSLLMICLIFINGF